MFDVMIAGFVAFLVVSVSIVRIFRKSRQMARRRSRSPECADADQCRVS